jgi:hypothetical protein
MHDPDLPSPEDAREGLTGRPEGMISIRQDDRLDSLIARLGREFAVVEQDEQRLDAVDLQPSYQAENVSFDAAEQFADRADGNLHRRGHHVRR